MSSAKIVSKFLRPGRSAAIAFTSIAKISSTILRPGRSAAISLTSSSANIVFSLIKRDTLTGGHGYIAGVVEILGTPTGNRRVRLFNKNDGRLVRQTYSADDGTFRFNYLPMDRYFILISEDPTATYEITAHDNVFPVSLG